VRPYIALGKLDAGLGLPFRETIVGKGSVSNICPAHSTNELNLVTHCKLLRIGELLRSIGSPRGA